MTDGGREPGSADAAPTPVQAGLHGLCPRCGARTLFAGWARFAKNCPVCGLDYDQFNVGDGPAAFLTLILGTFWVTVAVVVELKYSPPLWLHAVIWLPLLIVSTLLSLRVAKGMLMAAEFRNAAREGRIVR